MLKFALYLNIKEDGEVLFHNELFSSFNVAKEKMEEFLEEFAKKRGKKVVEITKEDFEKLKNSKKIEDVFYIRKKNSEIIIYSRGVLPGTFYNSYTLEKFGKISVNEFLISSDEEKEPKIEDFEIRNLHITNHERGTHVTLVSELKDVLSKRYNKNIPENIGTQTKIDTSFIESLIEGKEKLKTVN
jgi:hypothetical protein